MSARSRQGPASGRRFPRTLRAIVRRSRRLARTFGSDLLLAFCDHASCSTGGGIVSDRLRARTDDLLAATRHALAEAEAALLPEVPDTSRDVRPRGS